MRLVVPFLLVVTSLGAQELATKDTVRVQEPRLRYYFYVRSGTLIGCTNCSFESNITYTTSMIHGVRIGRALSVGAGTGFNSYATARVMPYFGSVTLNLGGKKNKLFTEFNFGSGKVWAGEMEEKMYGFKDLQAKRMVQTSIGYSLAYYKMRVYVMVGYHFQRLVKTYEYPNSFWIGGQLVSMAPNRSRIISDYNRLVLSLGVGWK